MHANLPAAATAPRALIVSGGWPGHAPFEVAAFYRELLAPLGYLIEDAHHLECLTAPPEELGAFDLIIPNWTMGELPAPGAANLSAAIAAHGTGLAGTHGGMGDALRADPAFQFIVGGQFVAHPGDGDITYPCEICHPGHDIIAGLPLRFTVSTEQYYMHTDPANEVLMGTPFPQAPGPHTANGAFTMPLAWVRRHGSGRVFYHSLGHSPAVLRQPEVARLTAQGFRWATRPPRPSAG